jgi:hypothetical protein
VSVLPNAQVVTLCFARKRALRSYSLCTQFITGKVWNGDELPCSALYYRKVKPKVEGSMADFNEAQNLTFYRVRIKDGHNAVGLLVSTAGKRCIPSTQFWLTVDACAAYRFPQNAALRVQVRLGDIGFTTVLEEIQD